MCSSSSPGSCRAIRRATRSSSSGGPPRAAPCRGCCSCRSRSPRRCAAPSRGPQRPHAPRSSCGCGGAGSFSSSRAPPRGSSTMRSRRCRPRRCSRRAPGRARGPARASARPGSISPRPAPSSPASASRAWGVAARSWRARTGSSRPRGSSHSSRRPRRSGRVGGCCSGARAVRAALACGRAPGPRERSAATARRACGPGVRSLPRPRPLRRSMAPHQLSRPRRLILALLAAAALWPAVARAERSFIPIPEIITDPNEGNTVGLLGVLLFLDEKDQIQYMLAPDLRYNKTTGIFPAFRFFGYPSPERRYSVVVAKSTTKDEDYELEYTDRSLWDGRGFLLASFLHEADSTERFFGFGNESREERPHPGRPAGPGNLGGESNYTDVDTQAQATPGVWVLPYANLSYRMRIRRYAIEEGQVSGIPFIASAHPETRGRGFEGGVFWAHQVALTYDSRDSTDIPTRGALGILYGELTDKRIGSASSFVKFGADWRDFIPLRKGNPILALHALANYTSGDRDTPFWELSSLGGERSLRGFGSHRLS